MEGLTPRCFHNVEETHFQWARSLGEQYNTIWNELEKYNEQVKIDGKVWLPPRDASGSSYGPEWKTLGLQDRGVWDEEKLRYFPKTVSLLKEVEAPSCEVFFAKQGPNSGILPHTDKNNFIITCHIPLSVRCIIFAIII